MDDRSIGWSITHGAGRALQGQQFVELLVASVTRLLLDQHERYDAQSPQANCRALVQQQSGLLCSGLYIFMRQVGETEGDPCQRHLVV